MQNLIFGWFCGTHNHGNDFARVRAACNQGPRRRPAPSAAPNPRPAKRGRRSSPSAAAAAAAADSESDGDNSASSVATSPEEWQKWAPAIRKDGLKAECEKAGLRTSGSVADLIARLVEAKVVFTAPPSDAARPRRKGNMDQKHAKGL